MAINFDRNVSKVPSPALILAGIFKWSAWHGMAQQHNSQGCDSLDVQEPKRRVAICVGVTLPDMVKAEALTTSHVMQADPQQTRLHKEKPGTSGSCKILGGSAVVCHKLWCPASGPSVSAKQYQWELAQCLMRSCQTSTGPRLHPPDGATHLPAACPS